MIYISTRNNANQISSMEAIKSGISPEGGLYVPQELPKVTKEMLSSMIAMEYRERAEKLLKLFLTDYTDKDIEECVSAAYNNKNFHHDDIAPVIGLGNNICIQELWHGPTCAFKDMALQILPHLMKKAMERTGEKKETVILVATSGDTGKAAMEGFKNVDGTRVIVFYPNEGVSKIQELQMATQEGKNVHVVAVNGNFDDAQSGVKKIFGDDIILNKLDEKDLQFSSANSINWGRLVPQVVYYFSAYLDMLKCGYIMEGESFNVVVPTGNFGNILAAYYAKMMGLPVNKLICASNKNRVLTDFINSGVYDRRREFHKTMSPSMDILVSSNLERLLFEIMEHDDKSVSNLMKDLGEKGIYTIDKKYHDILKSHFWGGSATEEETLATINNVYKEHNYLLDPHTAVGKHVYDEYVKATNDKCKTLLVSTASPYKFPKDVLKAIMGDEFLRDKDEFSIVDMLGSTTQTTVPRSLSQLRSKKIIHTKVFNKDDMSKAVCNILDLDEV